MTTGRNAEAWFSGMVQGGLNRLRRSTFVEEQGQSGNMRLTLSAVLPVEIAGQIADMVREHQIRR